jgi:hypothetical protein
VHLLLLLLLLVLVLVLGVCGLCVGLCESLYAILFLFRCALLVRVYARRSQEL